MNHPPQMQATASGTRSKGVKVGEMQSMHIERADNGFTVETRRKPKPTKRNEVMDWDAGREQKVFNNVDDMLAHIRQMCSAKPKKAEQ